MLLTIPRLFPSGVTGFGRRTGSEAGNKVLSKENAKQHRDDELTLRGRGLRSIDLFEQGNLTAMEDEVARHGELSEGLRQPYYRWQTLVSRATLALFAGRVEVTDD